MDVLSENLSVLLYVVASVCFILALRGLSSPGTERRGKVIGAVGAAIAVVTVLLSQDLDHFALILLALVIGAALAVVMARRARVEQLLSLFTASAGAAAVLLALVELSGSPIRVAAPFDFLQPEEQSLPIPASASLLATAVIVLLGAVCLAGSLTVLAKLAGRVPDRPVVPRGINGVLSAAGAISLGLAVLVVAQASLGAAIGLAVVGLIGGALLVLPVDGPDLPIVVSLLNALAGVAVAAAGLVLGNTVLLIAGALIGAAGLVLTRQMAWSTDRTLVTVLFGALQGGAPARSRRSDGPDSDEFDESDEFESDESGEFDESGTARDV